MKVNDRTVVRSESGTPVLLEAGAEVPGWAVDQIGPHLLDGPVQAAASPAGNADAPPRAGAGSGREAWAEFAAAHGVTVGDDLSRNEIIEACEQAGVVAAEE